MPIFNKLERKTGCYVNVCQLKKMSIFNKLERRTACFENVCQLKISASPKHVEFGPGKRMLMPKKAGISWICAQNRGHKA